MGIFSKTQPDPRPAGPSSDPSAELSGLAAERILAAKRLDAALIEVEKSIEALFTADRAFFDGARRLGRNDHGTAGNLRRVLRTLIVGQMQNAAPQFIKVLGIPYQPMRTRGPIAAAVERTTDHDLNNLALVSEQKETEQ
jgi:hypothetical protein